MNVNYTVNSNLCLGCGLCEDICPKSAINIQIHKGEHRPHIDEHICMKDKCGKCTSICPGLGVDFHEITSSYLPDNLHNNKYLGKYNNLYTGHCTDEEIRYHSASGGLVTGLLIWLIEKDIIQGAVVTRFSTEDHINPEVFIARSREELISARSSKYCPVSMQGIRKQIREAEGKYIIVGLPCHIQGFRKIEKIDKKFKEHIFAYWGLFCSSGRTFHLTDYVLQQRHINKKDIHYFAYRDEGCLGNMLISYSSQNSNNVTIIKEKYEEYYHALRSFFIPRRCHYCIDHTAELSDISFGDIHIKPYSDDVIGTNSMIVRNPKMKDLLNQACQEKHITLEQVAEDEIVRSQKMAQTKKNKYASIVYWGKRMGMKVPQYDTNLKGKLSLHNTILYMLNLNMQYQIGHHRGLWPVINYLKKKRKK